MNSLYQHCNSPGVYFDMVPRSASFLGRDEQSFEESVPIMPFEYPVKKYTVYGPLQLNFRS